MYKKIFAYGRSPVIRNFGVYGFGQAFNLITPLLVIPYIISVCGLAFYGQAAIGMALMFFLMVFVDFGSDIAGVRAVATNRDDKNVLQKIIGITYGIKLFMLVAVSCIISIIFLTIPYFSADRSLFFLSLPILIGQFLNPTWLLQGIEDFKQITVINILSKLIYVIGIFSFVKFPSDYIYINLWWGIGMIVANAVSVYLVFRKYQVSWAQFSIDDIRHHLITGFPIFSSQLFVSIQLYSPLLLIGFFGTAFLAGIYRVVDQIVVVFKTYILLFFNFTFPRVCFLISTSPEKAQKYWRLFNCGNLVLVILSMIIVNYFASPVVQFFTQEHISEISALFPTAVWIPILMALSVPLKQLVLGYGFNRYYVNATVSVVILNVAMILILLPVHGILGVLYAIIVTEIITATLFFLKIKNKLFLPRN